MGPWGRSITRHPGINYRGNNRGSAAIRADFAEKGGRGPTTFCPYGDERGATTDLVEVLEPSTAVSAALSLPEIGFGIGIAHGFVTLGTIGYEGRFDYAAIGTVSNVASRLCDEAKPGANSDQCASVDEVENTVKVEPVGEFVLKGIRRPLAAYNVVASVSPTV
jgi:class 3 adenylate cyclase